MASPAALIRFSAFICNALTEPKTAYLNPDRRRPDPFFYNNLERPLPLNPLDSFTQLPRINNLYRSAPTTRESTTPSLLPPGFSVTGLWVSTVSTGRSGPDAEVPLSALLILSQRKHRHGASGTR